MKRFALALALVASLSVSLSAQCTSLAVNTTGGNAQSGYMFDIANTSAGPVTITGFGVVGNSTGVATFEIRTLNVTGSYLALAANLTAAANWTVVGTSAGVPLAPNTPVSIPAVLSVVIPAGTTQAFYITTTSTAATVSYTTGVAGQGFLGTPIASNSLLTVFGGNGKAYAAGATFGATFGGNVVGAGGRLFRGEVRYSTGATLNNFDTNTPGASLTVNGVQNGPCAVTSQSFCVGDSINIALTTDQVGLGFDAAFNFSGLVALGSGGLQVGTQGILNLDILGGLNFLNGGVAPAFLPNPGAITLSFPMPSFPAPGLSAQFINFSVASPDGFELSQPVNFSSVPGTPSVVGPATDDSSVAVNLGTPNCFGGSFGFMGTTFTQAQVISNGRVMFGTADVDFSPTVAEALTDAPFVGAWTDLNPAVGGNITITPAGNGFSVNYNGVANFGIAGSSNTFSFGFDNSTGAVTVNLGTFNAVTAAGGMFLGLSAGTLGATDAGATAFTVGGAGAGAAASDMLYEFNGTGLAPAIGAGVTSITFLPVGGLAYAWTAL